MAKEKKYTLRIPRRRLIRWVLRVLANIALFLLTKLKVTGLENVPKDGPFLIIANHFSFVDPVLIMAKIPYWMEFIGGTVNPGAPNWTAFIPKLWGVLNVYRGSSSREALLTAQSVLEQEGVLCIMPEGGNWAHVLRPARPGTAFLAQRVSVPILPVGFVGLEDIFHNFRLFHRAPIEMRIGKPFGPLGNDIKGRPSKEEYDEMGHEMMRHISTLIRPEQRGFYSDDPAIRAAAKGTEVWPWDEKREGEVDKFRKSAR